MTLTLKPTMSTLSRASSPVARIRPLPGSTLGMANALQYAKDNHVVGGGLIDDLTQQEKINRTLELVKTSNQIYQVSKELDQTRLELKTQLASNDLSESQKETLRSQQTELSLLDFGLESSTSSISSGISQTLQTGFNKGVGKFVVENATAIGQLLYDASIIGAMDDEAVARNHARVEGIAYLVTHLDELPDKIATAFKNNMTAANDKFEAGDYEGGMEIFGELEAGLYTATLGAVPAKLTSEAITAINKFAKNSRSLDTNINPQIASKQTDWNVTAYTPDGKEFKIDLENPDFTKLNKETLDNSLNEKLLYDQLKQAQKLAINAKTPEVKTKMQKLTETIRSIISMTSPFKE